MKRWLPLMMLCALALGALAVGGRGQGTPTAQERADAIAARVKCPVCQGQSVAQSRTGLAIAIHDEIKRQVDLDKSDAEIIGYISDKYGDGLLINPPATGAGAVVWAAPIAALIFGFAGLGVALRRWRAKAIAPVLGSGQRLRVDSVNDGAAVPISTDIAAAPSGSLSSSLLVAERDFLIRSIADLDLEHAAGDLADSDLRSLRASYTQRVADVDRRMAGDQEQAQRDARTALLLARSRRRTRAFLAVAAVFAVGCGFLLAGALGERKAGQTITGNAASDPRTQKINELMQRAQELASTDPLGSIEAYDQITKLNPDVVAAWAYGGWQMRIFGRAVPAGAQQDELFAAAKRRIDEAIRRDPTYPDAYAFRAVMSARDLGDDDAARAALKTLDGLDHSPMIDQLTGPLREDLGMAPAPAMLGSQTAPTTAAA